MRQGIQIVIGFLHDFAAGGWVATMLALYWLDRQGKAMGLGEALAGLERQFFHAALGCVAIILLTGAGRSFTYVNQVYGQAAEATRRRLLIIKHIVLFIIFGAGMWWQFVIVFG